MSDKSSFLSKLGSVLLKGLGIVTVFKNTADDLGFSNPYTNAVNSELTLIAGIILDTEAIKQDLQLPGEQALKAATPRVSQIILKSALMIGKVIKNPGLFNRGCSKIADGFVDILDAVDED